MKVIELNPPELDFWVAKAEGAKATIRWQPPNDYVVANNNICKHYRGGLQRRWQVWEPSTRWEQGGPILEKFFHLPARNHEGDWCMWIHGELIKGSTLLIVAMRVYVAGKFGEEVEGTASHHTTDTYGKEK